MKRGVAALNLWDIKQTDVRFKSQLRGGESGPVASPFLLSTNGIF